MKFIKEFEASSQTQWRLERSLINEGLLRGLFKILIVYYVAHVIRAEGLDPLAIRGLVVLLTLDHTVLVAKVDVLAGYHSVLEAIYWALFMIFDVRLIVLKMVDISMMTMGDVRDQVTVKDMCILLPCYDSVFMFTIKRIDAPTAFLYYQIAKLSIVNLPVFIVIQHGKYLFSLTLGKLQSQRIRSLYKIL